MPQLLLNNCTVATIGATIDDFRVTLILCYASLVNEDVLVSHKQFETETELSFACSVMIVPWILSVVHDMLDIFNFYVIDIFSCRGCCTLLYCV